IAPRPLPQRVPRIPAGLPSQLLERRPDVAAAERALAAANARIGVARAAFFPVLQLTASGGYESGSLSDLFRWSSRTWLLGPLAGTILNTPIFTGGRLSADLDRAWAEYDEAVGRYRQTVLAAFAEVEDALIGLRLLGAQARANADALEAARRATEIAEARYRAGAANYLEVIDAQRSELAIRRLAVQIEGERHTATVALVRALGGGWQTATPLAAND
ncbi:MAG: efflux transporter outer membrane subunit, partial [Burkholderiales bacterium]|nr:efflux transporter outer membrane subunit [Burkholderiales bacterium]